MLPFCLTCILLSLLDPTRCSDGTILKYCSIVGAALQKRKTTRHTNGGSCSVGVCCLLAANSGKYLHKTKYIFTTSLLN